MSVDSNNSCDAPSDALLQLVSFRVGFEEYGIDIMKIHEINRMPEITRVPRAPGFVDGIINLRGRIIPIINMRRKFKLDEKENDKDTRIVVVDIVDEVIGLVVDSVNEVLRIPGSLVEPPPNVTGESGSACISGVARLDDRLLILLDLDRLVSDELAVLSDGISKPSA